MIVLNSKILTLLGFAAKAGKLSFGLDTCIQALKENKSFLVVTAEDISPKTLKEATFFAQKSGVKLITPKGVDIFTISNAVGRKCGVISVNDKGFAEAICLNFVGGNANDE